MDANDRLAMKAIRVEVNRILVRWDPMALKGLPNGTREYEQYAGRLAVMARKGEDYMKIARTIRDLAQEEWRVPQPNEKCVEIAKKVWNAGAMYRGEEPMK